MNRVLKIPVIFPNEQILSMLHKLPAMQYVKYFMLCYNLNNSVRNVSHHMKSFLYNPQLYKHQSILVSKCNLTVMALLKHCTFRQEKKKIPVCYIPVSGAFSSIQSRDLQLKITSS